MTASADIIAYTPVPDWLRKARRQCDDPLKAARDLRALIDSHSDEGERLAYLPEAVVRGIADAGLYGMMVPREFGGSEPHPVQLFEAIAELSYADGSTGWAVMAKRKQRFGRQTLIDQSIFQHDFAVHEAMLAASLDNCRNAFSRHYDLLTQGKDSPEIRAEYRLAACWAVAVALKVGQFGYLASGSDGLRNMAGTNRLQRCFRDIHAGTQHRHTDHNVIGDCGQVLLGVARPTLVL